MTASLAPGLDALRPVRAEGALSDGLELAPGLHFHADSDLAISGRWRSPAGRLLEVEARAPGQGDWAALHVALDAADLTDRAWIGFACRHAAPHETVIRPALRSGTGEGFADLFFPRHILSGPEPRDHVDAIRLAGARDLPDTAPWRELVLFLPRSDFTWHLHDLRPVLL